MKTWITFIMFLMVRCSPDKHVTIEKILLSDEFLILAHNQGCFGDSDMTLKIYSNGNNRMLEYPTSLSDPRKIMRKPLTDEDEQILQEFLIEGIKENNDLFCTAFSTYKVGTFWNSISFEDGSCKMYRYLEKLME